MPALTGAVWDVYPVFTSLPDRCGKHRVAAHEVAIFPLAVRHRHGLPPI